MVSDKLKEIISEYTDVDAQKIDNNANLQCDMGIDSFSMISMVNEIETTFDISIPDEELANFSTLNDMINYIEARAN